MRKSMIPVQCSPGLLPPNDLNFLHQSNFIRRAGIIPVINYDGQKYVLLGLSKDEKPVWADLGGRAEQNETTLETAVREFTEESRGTIPLGSDTIDKIIITNRDSNRPDQVILMIQLEPSLYNLHINSLFRKTKPQTKYEDEMSVIRWIPYEDFLSMSEKETTRSIQKVIEVLR